VSLPLASSPSVWWYATRSAGTVALVLLTASVVLGVLDLGRWQSERWPRFVVDGLHRTISLLALSMVAVHVLTTIADSFTSIGLRDAFIPFAASYRSLWLGFGTLAFDLLLAVAVTSLLRRRIGHRAWRGVHWASYACWPLALLHGLGTGTDTPVPWMLLLALVCALAVLAAIGWRVAATWPQDRRARSLAGALAAATLIALVIWTATGPLAARWASRAGTPASLLASVGATSSTAGPTTSAAAPTLPSRFSDRLAGSLHQRLLAGGSLLMVDIRSKLTGQVRGSLEVQIEGQPAEGGGVAMTASRVALGPPSEPLAYRGQLTSLSGNRLLARVSNGSSSLAVRLDLAIDQATGEVQGSATAQPAPSSS
jgi:sulfoxide reductase heme-binding subunit YedZ